MAKEKKPNKKEILDAIKRLEENPNNRGKILGEIGVAGIGAAGAGVAAALFGGSVASIPVVTALTGFGVAVAAPISLVAIAAVGGGAAAYGLAKFVSGGARDEGKREEIKRKLKERLREIQNEEQKAKSTEENKNAFIIFLKEPIKQDLITAEQAKDLIELVENGQISLEEAYKLIGDIIGDSRGLPPSSSK